MEAKAKIKFGWSENRSQMIDVEHLNDECQSDLNIKLFDVQHSVMNIKITRMSKIKLRHFTFQ